MHRGHKKRVYCHFSISLLRLISCLINQYLWNGFGNASTHFCILFDQSNVAFEAITLGRFCHPLAKSFRSLSASPIWQVPFLTAIVAGTTSSFLKIDSASKARSKFWGYGMPCATMVDSRATTGLDFVCKASFTSGWICSLSLLSVCGRCDHEDACVNLFVLKQWEYTTCWQSMLFLLDLPVDKESGVSARCTMLNVGETTNLSYF